MGIMVLALSQGYHAPQDGLVRGHRLGLLPVTVWLGLANTAFFWAAGSSVVVSVPYMREVWGCDSHVKKRGHLDWQGCQKSMYMLCLY